VSTREIGIRYFGIVHDFQVQQSQSGLETVVTAYPRIFSFGEKAGIQLVLQKPGFRPSPE